MSAETELTKDFELPELLAQWEVSWNEMKRLIYFSVPPSFFSPTLARFALSPTTTNNRPLASTHTSSGKQRERKRVI